MKKTLKFLNIKDFVNASERTDWNQFGTSFCRSSIYLKYQKLELPTAAMRQNQTETVLKNRFRFRSGSSFFRFRELDFETLDKPPHK